MDDSRTTWMPLLHFHILFSTNGTMRKQEGQKEGRRESGRMGEDGGQEGSNFSTAVEVTRETLLGPLPSYMGPVGLMILFSFL